MSPICPPGNFGLQNDSSLYLKLEQKAVPIMNRNLHRTRKYTYQFLKWDTFDTDLICMYLVYLYHQPK